MSLTFLLCDRTFDPLFQICFLWQILSAPTAGNLGFSTLKTLILHLRCRILTFFLNFYLHRPQRDFKISLYNELNNIILPSKTSWLWICLLCQVLSAQNQSGILGLFNALLQICFLDKFYPHKTTAGFKSSLYLHLRGIWLLNLFFLTNPPAQTTTGFKSSLSQELDLRAPQCP